MTQVDFGLCKPVPRPDYAVMLVCDVDALPAACVVDWLR